MSYCPSSLLYVKKNAIYEFLTIFNILIWGKNVDYVEKNQGFFLHIHVISFHSGMAIDKNL